MGVKSLTTILIRCNMLRREKVGRFWVVASRARMPNSCWGSYARVGVLEMKTEDSPPPQMLSARPKRVVRVVRTWESVHIGKTDECAFEHAWNEACDLAESLARKEGWTLQATTN
jgi:hypothetical protein